MGFVKSATGKSVRAIIILDGKVLLTMRDIEGARKLALPGGDVMPGETPETTLAREVKRETGLEVRPQTLAGVHFGETWCVAFNCDIESGSLNGDTTYMDVDEALRSKDIGELTRLFLAGRERALEKDAIYDMKNEGCSLYL